MIDVQYYIKIQRMDDLMSNENSGSVDIMSTGDKPKTELMLVGIYKV